MYAYDAIGNISNYNINGYTYGAKPHAATTVNGDQRYWYDANGNMVTRAEVSGSQRITYTQGWDIDNHLIAVTDTQGAVTRYAYDADGQRVLRTNPDATSVAYVGDLYEVQVGSGVTTSYYFFGDQRVAVRIGGTLTYLHADYLGSASLATSVTGTLVSELRYYPFGQVRFTSGAMPTDHTFTGQRAENFSAVGSLMDYGARFYSPLLGRFISADSIVPRPGDPQAFNRYTYADNSPTNRLDPNGHADSCNPALYSCGYASTVSDDPVDYMPHYSTSYQKSYARKIRAYWQEQRAQAKALAEFFKKLNDPFRDIRRSQPKSSNLFGFPFASDLRSPSSGTVPLGPPTPSQNLSKMSPDSPCLMTSKCDYHVLSISTGPIGPITNIYITKRDVYVSYGMNIGTKGLSVSYYSGQIENQVSPKEFFPGTAVNVSGGFLFGAAHTWTNNQLESDEGGIYLPVGLGIAQTITALNIGPDGIVFYPKGE